MPKTIEFEKNARRTKRRNHFFIRACFLYSKLLILCVRRACVATRSYGKPVRREGAAPRRVVYVGRGQVS